MMRNKRRMICLWLAAALLIAAGVIIQRSQEVAPQHLRRPLDSLGFSLAGWRAVGPDYKLDERTLELLKPQSYLMRRYMGPRGRICTLFVGYFGLQQEGQMIHSPRHCLPGSGWQIQSRHEVEVTAEGEPYRVNHLVISNGLEKISVLYWYQGRGQIQADEYLDRLRLILDAVELQRSDGALVRLTSVMNPTDPGTLKRQLRLAGALIPALKTILPPPGPAGTP